MKDTTNEALAEELEMFIWHLYENYGEVISMKQLREGAQAYLSLRRRGDRVGGRWIAGGWQRDGRANKGGSSD